MNCVIKTGASERFGCTYCHARTAFGEVYNCRIELVLEEIGMSHNGASQGQTSSCYQSCSYHVCTARGKWNKQKDRPQLNYAGFIHLWTFDIISDQAQQEQCGHFHLKQHEPLSNIKEKPISWLKRWKRRLKTKSKTHSSLSFTLNCICNVFFKTVPIKKNNNIYNRNVLKSSFPAIYDMVLWLYTSCVIYKPH